MVQPADDEEKRRAQTPHNLFISGVFLFDLLLTPAAIAMKIGMYGLLVPLLLSLSMVIFIYIYGRSKASGYVAEHWRLAFKHCRWLMAGYGVTAMLILLGWLLSSTAGDHMKDILWVALTRIAILPTLAAVMITLLAEAGAMSSASKGEAIKPL